jgi:hypothetical protein
MSGLNFKGVDEVKETVMTAPGTIDVFTIKDVVFETTKNKGTYYMGVTFNNKSSEFKHSFFLSEKALPRVKSLVKHATGKVLEDEVLEEQIIKMLKGKELAMKVTAKIDEETGRAYPDLSFGGFSKEKEKIDELFFSDKEIELNKTAAAIRAAGSMANADKEEAVAVAVEITETSTTVVDDNDPDFI